jgi:DNA-binding GntR family transcriptional regulator
MNASVEISERIMEAVLARRLLPGARLGEGQLAPMFGCSRTIVREALTRLAERGVVHVSARRGWYLADPSPEEVREAFEARLIIETGLLRATAAVAPAALEALRAHLGQQEAAIRGGDPGMRSLLLGEFHVRLAALLGNRPLAEAIRGLAVRTTLSAARHQSAEDADLSYREHVAIVSALADGDPPRAEALMAAHLGSWRVKLRVPPAAVAPDAARPDLRQALRPLRAPPGFRPDTSRPSPEESSR